MYYNIRVQTLTLLYLTFTASGLPILSRSSSESLQLLRRTSYSVVAVDGGPATTNSEQQSPTQTLTLTSSETKTLSQSNSPTEAVTALVKSTPITTTTVTSRESAPTVTVTHTVGGENPATGVASVLTSTLISTQFITATGGACGTPSAVPDDLKTTTIVQTSTITNYMHGSPPKPTTYSNGGAARYTASQTWNSTLTFQHGPTGTAWPTGEASSSFASQMH